MAANLYSGGWHESFGMIISVAVGFLKIVDFMLLLAFKIVISTTLILFSDSYSIVNCIEGVKTIYAI